jgi:uncharacterized protein YjbJ (UPF0337 family)
VGKISANDAVDRPRS